jgi:16S rRNA (cytosine967-C5)-methyltransferase
VLLAASDEEMRADDRALCYELVLGVLRWQYWLDGLIEHYAQRSSESLDAPVRLALRLGLYQLRFLSRIPASAVVNESVNLAHLARVRSAAGLINAILRRVTREPNYDPAANVVEPIERMARMTSHPAWLIERWIEEFGSDETEAFARSNNEAPPVAFRVVRQRVVDGPNTLDELRAEGAQLEPSRIAPGGWRIQGARGRLRTLAREGRIYIQDEASQLVAHVMEAQAGERVLDACAAPGSKTTHLADLADDGAALIVACDLYAHRLRTVLESSARQNLKSVSAVALDAETPLPFAEQTFDRVLVDAPCSGTGTLRRNPEIRWRISTSDILELSSRQQRILSNASRMLRRGGRLVYSTCSVERQENEAVADAFLEENVNFRPISISILSTLPGTPGSARTWPHRDGADGFFIAAFERQG